MAKWPIKELKDNTLPAFKQYIDHCIDMLYLIGWVKWEKDDIKRLSEFLEIERFTSQDEPREPYWESLVELIKNKWNTY